MVIVKQYSSKYKNQLIQALRENNIIVLFSLLLICGMIFGAVFARNASFNILDKLDFLFYSNFKTRASQPIISIFAASFASSFIFILVCFLCGLSVWGMFIIPAVLFFRGFGLGLTSGYLYAAYKFMGVLFNLVVILPGAFLCCISILLAAREGSRFSKAIASSATLKKGTISQSKMKIYLLRFGIFLMIAFLASLLDVFFSVCFGGLFSL